MGLINSGAPQAAAPEAQAAPAAPAGQFPTGAEQPGSTLKNPILNQIETEVEATLKPEQQRMYQGIMVAGMKLAFDPKTHPKLLEGLKSSPDMGKNISLVCVGIISMIFDQTKPDVNEFLPAAVPAVINLMCQIMEFAEGAGLVEVTPELTAAASSAAVKGLFKKAGIDDNMVKQAIEQGKQKQPGAAAPMGAQ